jgi:hypothetical protein
MNQAFTTTPHRPDSQHGQSTTTISWQNSPCTCIQDTASICSRTSIGQSVYRGIVGKLNFLAKRTRPDIAYATHQIERFSQDPKRTHGEAVLWLCKYLLRETRNDGLILDPRLDKSLEVYGDADFAGNWNKSTAAQDISTAKS